VYILRERGIYYLLKGRDVYSSCVYWGISFNMRAGGC